jgi:hypothetical protein
MSLLKECPLCHRAQAISHDVCISCGLELNKYKSKVNYWIQYYKDGKQIRKVVKGDGFNSKSLKDALQFHALHTKNIPKNKSGGAINTPVYTYFIKAKKMSAIKVGITTCVLQRLTALQTASPYKLKLMGYINGDREKEIHKIFEKDRLHGEWFSETQELVNFIKNLNLLTLKIK